MAKRFFPIFSIMLLLISLVAPGIQPVAAEEKEDKVYEDGEYDITAKALHADKDEASGAAGFIDEAAKILIENGQIKLAISIPNNEMAEIKGLQIEGIDPVKEETDDSVIYTYALNELKEILNAQVQYEVESMGMEHDVPLRFKLEGINEIPEQDDEDESSEEDESEGNEGSEDKDESEGNEDTEEGTDSEENEDIEDGAESEDNEDIEEGVESEDNEDTEEGAESEDNEDTEEGTDSEENEGTEDGNESEDNEGTEDDGESGDNGSSDDNSTEQKVYEDGEFKLDYTVDVPAMDRYMEKPAQLIIDEGENEVIIRFNTQQFIDKFEVEKDGKLVDAKRQAVDDDFVDYVFSVDDLAAPLHSKITIDAMGRTMEHEFNITFDTSGLTEVKPDPNNLADGTYSINHEILHEKEDKASTAAGYIVNPAQLSVKDGVKTVYFTITDNESIKDVKIEQNGTLSSAKTVEIDEENNTRLIAFEVEDLDAVLKSQFKVYVPAIDYDAEPFARIQFDTDSIKKSEGDLPEVPTKPELKEGGAYTINLRVLEQDEFKKSPIGNYIKMPVDLTLQDGKNIVYLTLLDSKKIKDVKIEKKAETNNFSLFNTNNLEKISNDNFESAQVVKEDKEENERIISFDINDLDGQVNALVTLDEGGTDKEYPVRLFFEENSVKESDGLPNLEPEKPSEPTEPADPTLDPKNLEEGYYKLDYTFLEKGTDNPSAMDGFTDGPAYVKVDGKGNQSIAMTLTSADWIKGYKVNNKDAKILQEDKKEDTRVVEFDVKDLTKKQAAWVSVDAGFYKSEYDVDLTFDTNTLTGIQEKEYPEDQNVESEPEDPEEIEDPEGEEPTNPENPSKPLDPKKLEEGYYKLDYTFFKDGEDNVSSMDNFTDGSAYVKVDKKGKQSVAMTFTSASMIGDFNVNGNTAKVLQENKKEDTRTVEFAVKDLTKKQSGSVYVEVPGMYAMEHKVDLVFDTNTLSKIQEKEYPKDQNVKPKPGKPGDSDVDKPTKPSKPSEPLDPKKLGEGYYTLNYTFLEKGKSTPSTMDGFTDGPAYVKVDKKGNKHVAMTFTNADMIKYFKVNGETAKVLQENKKKDTRTVEFAVNDLTKKQAGTVFVEVPGMYATEHEIDLVFDTDTLSKAKDYPGDEKVPQKDSINKVDQKGNDIPKKPVNSDLNPKDLLAGEYKIDYSFLEKGTNNTSIMDGFTEGPAHVKVDKKGNKRVAITFTSADYIKGFEVNGKSTKVLQVDTKKDTMVVEFPVDDLTKKQAAWVSVDVPGVYKTDHEVDLVFHVNTLDVSKIYPENKDPKKSLSKRDGSTNSVEKVVAEGEGLGFDRDADGNIIGQGDNNQGPGSNPKTADLNMSQIVLFSSLLILSLIPFAIKLRRKFVTSK